MTRKHVVVIGGGAVGLISAYHLRRDGADVTIVDARQTGRGAAEVNAGWIVPAESAPVPGPGMISKSLEVDAAAATARSTSARPSTRSS